jgi:predicted Zn-dependent protease
LTDKNRHELDSLETLQLLAQVAGSNRFFYLHPSFGYFFEGFYLEPTGPIYEMKLRGKNPLDVPPLPDSITEANEKFWTGLWEKDLASLAPRHGRPSGFESLMAHYGLIPAPRVQDRRLAEWYSIPLDGWAVSLQKQGRLREAQARLDQALQLNTNNISARLTLVCNSNLQATGKMAVDDVKKVAAQLGSAEQLNEIRNSGGPFDEPTFGCIQSGLFLKQGLLFQAAEQLERVQTLATNVPTVELALADVYNKLNMASRSRKIIDQLHKESQNRSPNLALDLQLSLVDCTSWLLQTNKANAQSALKAIIKQYPNDPQVASRVLAAYLSFGDFTNALRLANDQVAKAPDDPTSQDNKAMVLLQSGQFDQAITILDHILTETNLPSVRINRAFAHLSKNDFNLAESDLRVMEKDDNVYPMVDLGLAVVAEHGHDTNLATHYLRLCMTNAPAGSPIWQQANFKLRTLEPSLTTR